LTQTIVFLVTTGLGVTTAPVKTTVALTVIGARVEVPAWDAVTTQFPALSRFRVDPEIAQFSGEELENETVPPLEAAALRDSDLLDTFSLGGSVKEIVCGLLVISKVCLYKSEAKYAEVAEVS
jgi:hypothetical protein